MTIVMKNRWWCVPCALLAAGLAQAHPMGNFSVSHYARFTVGADGVRIRYALDLAEIPTFELLRQWGLDGASPRADRERQASEQARQWVRGLRLRVDRREVTPKVERTEYFQTDGAGNMPVVRITSDLLLAVKAGRLEYEDLNFPDRAGWKEIVVEAMDGVSLVTTSHGGRDLSRALSAYPEDPTVAPPQELRAAMEWTVRGAPRASSAPAAPAPAPRLVPVKQPAAPAPKPANPASAAARPAQGVVLRGDALSQLLGHRDLSLEMILTGLAIAFGLGAMHAMSPGHGKTLVAAYLVGARGTFRHAAFLGAMVTFTHTISVFALGLATLFLSQYVVPEKVFPVLGAISGLSIVLIGASLLRRRWLRMRQESEHARWHREAVAHHHPHDRPHEHGHPHHHHAHHHDHHHGEDHHHHHAHGGLVHTHDGHTHSHMPEGDVTLGSLIALGASGGLVPCPSALVLLLSAIALGRTALGLLLLASFSLGLASVLIAIGVAVLYARNLLPQSGRFMQSPAFRLLPVVSAALIVCIGLFMTLVALGWVRPQGLMG